MQPLTSPGWLDLAFTHCTLPLHLGARAACISAKPISRAFLTESQNSRSRSDLWLCNPITARAQAVVCLVAGDLTSAISLVALNCLAISHHFIHCAKYPIASAKWIPLRCLGQLALSALTILIVAAITCALLPLALLSPAFFFHYLGIGAKIL